MLEEEGNKVAKGNLKELEGINTSFKGVTEGAEVLNI